RIAPFPDEELRAEGADVPGREIALRQNVRPGPVEQRRLAVVVGLREHGDRLRRRIALEPAQAALQPLAAARDLEVGGAEARLAAEHPVGPGIERGLDHALPRRLQAVGVSRACLQRQAHLGEVSASLASFSPCAALPPVAALRPDWARATWAAARSAATLLE